MVRPAILALVMAFACFAGTSDASAQCRLCSKPTTAPEQPEGGDKVALDIQTSLNFDQLIVDGGGSGSATIRPDGTSANAGSVADVSRRAMVGTVVLHGQAGRAIRVDMPTRIVLHSLGGGEVSFDGIVTDLPSLPRLDARGELTFRFGGRLRITGDAEGQYRGDLPITADYL